MLALLRTQGEMVLVPLAAQVAVTGDDHALAVAVADAAQYLVTGDRGLLAIGGHQVLWVLGPRFWRLREALLGWALLTVLLDMAIIPTLTGSPAGFGLGRSKSDCSRDR